MSSAPAADRGSEIAHAIAVAEELEFRAARVLSGFIA
jgi:hypothetical protein